MEQCGGHINIDGKSFAAVMTSKVLRSFDGNEEKRERLIRGEQRIKVILESEWSAKKNVSINDRA